MSENSTRETPRDQPGEPYGSSSTPQMGDHCTNDLPLGSLFRSSSLVDDVCADSQGLPIDSSINSTGVCSGLDVACRS